MDQIFEPFFTIAEYVTIAIILLLMFLVIIRLVSIAIVALTKDDD